MKFLDKLIIKNLQTLKTTIAIIVILIIIIYNALGFLFFQQHLNQTLFNVISSLFISFILITLIFYIFNKQKQHLDEQVDQLTEAYKYIGKINRKIDSLLELDMSSLDKTKNLSIKTTTETIFAQLRSLLNAKAGLLYLKKPWDYKIYNSLIEKKEFKQTFDNLIKKDLKIFKYSHLPDFKQKFIDHGVPETFFKKYELVAKPVYMHDKDIGLMLLLFSKGTPLEERDLNIIRVFSFYIALNITFKPDFTISQA